MKNNIPQPYVSESRDFQVFMRVLDFVQNAIKFDIDSMTNIIDTDAISGAYVDRLKSKIGFFTDTIYSDDTLRKVLSAFPHIVKYKGSEEGIVRCVNTFLNIMGIKEGCTIDVHNNDDGYQYMVRIGINNGTIDTTLLYDMLSYVLPTGYFVEVYFYEGTDVSTTKGILSSRVIPLTPTEVMNTQVRTGKVPEDSVEDGNNSEEHRVFNTVQLSTIYDPTNKESE